MKSRFPRRALLALPFSLMLALPASAQMWRQLSTATLSAGTASTNISLPAVAPGANVAVTNAGPATACVRLGNSGQTATTAVPPNVCIGSGQAGVIAEDGNTNIAAITASGSASLTVQVGLGTPTVVFGAVSGSGGSSGGGGGAVTVAEGADITEGATTDTAYAGSGASTLVGTGKGIYAELVSIYTKLTGSVAVTGTFWQATQPVSAVSLPLPAGAAQESGGNLATLAGAITSNVVQENVKQVNGIATSTGAGAVGTGSQRVAVGQDTTTIAGAAPGTAGTPSASVLSVQGASGGTPVPVSATALPLPTGAATSANQTNGSQQTKIVDGAGNVIASTSNNLNVQCANCSGSGVSTADEASFTAATSLFVGEGGFFQTTATNNPLSNLQQGMLQMTANRAMFANLRNASGTEVGTASAPLQVSLANTATNGTAVKVDPSAVTQPISVASAQVASGAFASGALASGAGADGWNTTQGAKADAVCGTATGTCSEIALLKFLNNAANSPIPAQAGTTANIGNVGGLAAAGSAPSGNPMYLGANASGATGGQIAGLIACDHYAFKHITSATDTLAVQGVASQTIYVCGTKARAAGTATWFIEDTASANANCSSTLTQIDVLNSEVVNSGVVDHTPFWGGLKNTSGHGLCINSTGTGGVDVGVYYAQF